MGTLTWTNEAQQWLEDIFEYIATEDINAAHRVIENIYDKTQLLKDHPELGYRHWLSARHVRILLYGHYRITYLVKNGGDIEILGVFHGALDINKYSI